MQDTDVLIVFFSRGYSNAQILWLENIMTAENIIIQHALSPFGEILIPGVGKVDGFYEQTNTVYEYHGDFWNGELYRKTIERDQKNKKFRI